MNRNPRASASHRPDHVRLDFPGADGGYILLTAETYMTQDGVGLRPEVYPTTIVPARYRGTYEGASGIYAVWLCFPASPRRLHTEKFWDGWDGSDLECMEFWAKAKEKSWPIGRGPTPDDAFHNLIERVCAAVGVAPGDFTEPPTWG
jgi:hypothetical protein